MPPPQVLRPDNNPWKSLHFLARLLRQLKPFPLQASPGSWQHFSAADKGSASSGPKKARYFLGHCSPGELLQEKGSTRTTTG